MTWSTSDGKNGESTWDTDSADEVPRQEESNQTKKLWVEQQSTRIEKVERIADCKGCGDPRVRVFFKENKFHIDVHDDGSFVEWTGEVG